MKSTFKLLALSLLAAGFLSACPKGEEPKEEPKEEEVVKEEVKKEEPKEEVKKEEPKEEPAKVDEAMYLKAAFETTCVKAHVNDAEKLKETLTEVYARYGFDEAKFGAAEKSMAENASTTTALKEKMKLCTKEIAGQLKEKSSEDLLKTEVKKDEKDPKKDPTGDHNHTPKTNLAGKYKSAVNAVGFSGAKIGLTVKKDNSVLCSFKGKREGKLFSYVLRGKIQKNGSFSANKKGVKISGSIKKGTASGSLSGSINKKAFKARFNAKK